MVQHRSTVRGLEEVKKEQQVLGLRVGCLKMQMGMLVCKAIPGWTPKVLTLPSPSPGTPFSSWAASPSSTFWAALLDGAVALVSERSFMSWSSADGPQRRINAYSINGHCISRSLRKICCTLETAESCSEHVCCQTPSSPAKTVLRDGPNLLNLLLDWEALLTRVYGLVWFKQLCAAAQAASLISWY